MAGPNPNTAYTCSSTLTRRSNVLVSKSGCTSIRRPPGSTTASPQLGSHCVGDFLVANSTFTNRPAEETGLRLLFQRRFFRWRSRVLQLKPRLWQNSLRRMPCSQTLTPTAVPQLVSAVSVPLPAVLRSSIQLEHRLYLPNRCVARTLTLNLWSAVLGLTLFPIGYMLHALRAKYLTTTIGSS